MKIRWICICLNVIKNILTIQLIQHQLKMHIIWRELYFASLFYLKYKYFVYLWYFICRAYNRSSSYRQCLYSIFDIDEICSADRFPLSYEYSKIYWKLVMSSCGVTNSKILSIKTFLLIQYINKCRWLLSSISFKSTSSKEMSLFIWW